MLTEREDGDRHARGFVPIRTLLSSVGLCAFFFKCAADRSIPRSNGKIIFFLLISSSISFSCADNRPSIWTQATKDTAKAIQKESVAKPRCGFTTSCRSMTYPQNARHDGKGVLGQLLDFAFDVCLLLLQLQYLPLNAL